MNRRQWNRNHRARNRMGWRPRRWGWQWLRWWLVALWCWGWSWDVWRITTEPKGTAKTGDRDFLPHLLPLLLEDPWVQPKLMATRYSAECSPTLNRFLGPPSASREPQKSLSSSDSFSRSLTSQQKYSKSVINSPAISSLAVLEHKRRLCGIVLSLCQANMKTYNNPMICVCV